MHFLYLLGALLPSLVSASQPSAGFQTPQRGEGHTLRPTRHPKDNPTDLVHLKAATLNQQLHYEDHQAVGTVTIPVSKYPLVSLDKSDLASATCNHASDTMTVAFKDDEAYAVACADWTTHAAGFVVISYIPGCGKGVDTLERSFHFVSSMQLHRDERRIVCRISPLDLMNVAHPANDIHIRAERFTDPSGKQAFYGVAPTKRLISGGGESDQADSGGGGSEQLDGGGRESEERGTEKKFMQSFRPTQIVKPVASAVTKGIKFFFSNPGYFEFDTSAARGSSKYTLVDASDFTATKTNKLKPTGYVEGAGLFCGDCYARSKRIGYVVNKKVAVEGGKVTFGDISITGGVDAQVTLELDGKVSIAAGLEKEFSIGVPGVSIDIKGILFIGPAFLFSLGVEGKLSLEGSLSIGYQCHFGSINSKLDPSDRDKAIADGKSMTPGCSLVGGPGIKQASTTLSVYATAGFGFKVQLFDSDKYNAEVSLKIKVALEVLFAYQPGCVKAKPEAAPPKPAVNTKVAVDVGVYIYAEGKAGRSTGQYNITSGTVSIYENCDGWSGPSVKGFLAGNPPRKGPPPTQHVGDPNDNIPAIEGRQIEGEEEQRPTTEPDSNSETSTSAEDPSLAEHVQGGPDIPESAPATSASPLEEEAQPPASGDVVLNPAPTWGESQPSTGGSPDDGVPATPPASESQSPDAAGSDTGDMQGAGPAPGEGEGQPLAGGDSVPNIAPGEGDGVPSDDVPTTPPVGESGSSDIGDGQGRAGEGDPTTGDESEGTGDEEEKGETESEDENGDGDGDDSESNKNGNPGKPASIIWSASEVDGNANLAVTISSAGQLVFTPDDGAQVFHTGVSTDPAFIYLDESQQRQMSADSELKSTGVGHVQMVDFGSLTIGSGDAIAFVFQSGIYVVSDANSSYNTAACKSADGTWSPLYLLADGKNLDALKEREPDSDCVAAELGLGSA